MSFHTVSPIQNPINGFLFLIEIINDRLSVISCGGSEHIDSIQLAHSAQKLQRIRSDIKFELISF